MGRFASFIEKIIISLVVAATIAFIKRFFPSSILFPDLHLYSGHKLLLGPPYCFLVITTGLVYVVLSSYISVHLWERGNSNGRKPAMCSAILANGYRMPAAHIMNM